jgi:molybdate transport system regulatory protein
MIQTALGQGPEQEALARLAASGDPLPMTVSPASLRLRLLFGDRLVLGPGKAELLAGIAKTGSIAAAGRAMGMSYKRAWSLVEEMNAAFRAPLVTSARGGAGGGGAVLTETGQAVLGAYRSMVAATDRACAKDIARLAALLADVSDGK